MRLAWLGLQALMLAVFLFAVAVQYNDPDPVQWMAIYGGAVVAQGAALANRRWWPAVAVATLIAAVAWAATYYVGETPFAPLGSLFDEFEMKNVGVEETREALGLTIVASWQAVLLAGRRLR